ncbi:MAG TPA: GNAT family N-acetyltransferase [Candidatus Dormibacteraeota bacterium]
MIGSDIEVRNAKPSDLDRINDIANQYIREAHYNFELVPMTMEARREWFSHYADTGRHRLLVGLAEGTLIGFASSGRYRPKPGYDTSIETSIYLAAEAVGRGAGSKLYDTLFKSLEYEDIHRAYAGIALPNPASIALHERFGFKRVAHFTEQGRKFDRYWDVAWYEKPMDAQPQVLKLGDEEAAG